MRSCLPIFFAFFLRSRVGELFQFPDLPLAKFLYHRVVINFFWKLTESCRGFSLFPKMSGLAIVPRRSLQVSLMALSCVHRVCAIGRLNRNWLDDRLAAKRILWVLALSDLRSTMGLDLRLSKSLTRDSSYLSLWLSLWANSTAILIMMNASAREQAATTLLPSWVGSISHSIWCS